MLHQPRASEAMQNPFPKAAEIGFDKSRVALSVMGSKQRGRKGGQGFGNAKPVKPLRKPQGKEHATQELTARRRFLAQMEQVVPWAELLEVLQPFYPQVGPQGGRPPYPLEVMLRTHLLQLWNSRSDQGTQDDLLDIIPFRAFSKIDVLAQGQAARCHHHLAVPPLPGAA